MRGEPRENRTSDDLETKFRAKGKGPEELHASSVIAELQRITDRSLRIAHDGKKYSIDEMIKEIDDRTEVGIHFLRLDRAVLERKLQDGQKAKSILQKSLALLRGVFGS